MAVRSRRQNQGGALLGAFGQPLAAPAADGRKQAGT
jgi:hypothetical protein